MRLLSKILKGVLYRVTFLRDSSWILQSAFDYARVELLSQTLEGLAWFQDSHRTVLRDCA